MMNGAVPDALLAPISTPGRLDILAGRSYDDMRAHAAAEGVRLTGTTSSTHAYRSLQEQEDLFYARYQTTYCEYAPGKVDKRYYHGAAYYRKPGQSAAAVPGTSNHGYGVAVDFQNLGGFGGHDYNWLARNAYVYGWDNAEGASIDEPWHWTYKADNDRHDPQEDDMPYTLDQIALAVWQAPAPGRPGVTMAQEVADIKTKLTRWENEDRVPQHPLTTDTRSPVRPSVTVVQEVADIKTKLTRWEEDGIVGEES